MHIHRIQHRIERILTLVSRRKKSFQKSRRKFGNDETFHQLTAQNREWTANGTHEKEKKTLELQLTSSKSNDELQSGKVLEVIETEIMKTLPGRPGFVKSGRRRPPKKAFLKEKVQPTLREDSALS
ncbi:hypothetical protein T11_4605 [Trichinella zimbabwensis]|uniref:Uncharacterized protein n=1 Tax=Trichinella zimbabwensis TaxID=268475 RepID=A0A0V1GT98_9BILA|nr:hypothetical protein T11_4605 [Trichinella zimbabwensis]